MKHLIKSLALAAALALPALFSGNALAIPGCGNCTVGKAPSSHVAYGVTNTTLCSTCHTAPAIPAIPATPGKPTTPATPATPASPGISVHPTTHSCGACVVGTAPGSVSAHKNVNTKGTACAMCHNSNLPSGTGGHIDDHRSDINRDDEHRGITGGMTGGQRNNHQGSPGNSDFGHSHKNGKKQHLDRDD